MSLLSRCPLLLVTGQQSIFNNTTKALHLAILKAVADRTKIEFVEVAGVANVLEERVCYFHCRNFSFVTYFTVTSMYRIWSASCPRLNSVGPTLVVVSLKSLLQQTS